MCVHRRVQAVGVEVTRLVSVTFGDREHTMRCPVCGETKTVESWRFRPSMVLRFYRHHVFGHLSGKL